MHKISLKYNSQFRSGRFNCTFEKTRIALMVIAHLVVARLRDEDADVVALHPRPVVQEAAGVLHVHARALAHGQEQGLQLFRLIWKRLYKQLESGILPFPKIQMTYTVTHLPNSTVLHVIHLVGQRRVVGRPTGNQQQPPAPQGLLKEEHIFHLVDVTKSVREWIWF